jgi:hypothetical protein
MEYRGRERKQKKESKTWDQHSFILSAIAYFLLSNDKSLHCRMQLPFLALEAAKGGGLPGRGELRTARVMEETSMSLEPKKSFVD